MKMSTCRNRNNTKFAAITLSLLLVVDSCAWAAAPTVSVAYNQTEAKIHSMAEKVQIPEAIGSIRERYIPRLPAESTLIHIQDAHSSLEAQKNIQKILQHLHSQYQLDLVLVEGGISKMDSGNLRRFQDDQANQTLADRLAKEGVISGSELFLLDQSLKNKNISMFGVEDLELYKKNVRSFGNVYAEKESSNLTLQKIKTEISTAASHILSKKLKKFFKDWLSYQDAKGEILRHINDLKTYASEELKIDFNNPRLQTEWPQLTRFYSIQTIENRLSMDDVKVQHLEMIQWLKTNKVDSTYIQEMESYVPGKGFKTKAGQTRILLERFYDSVKSKGFSFETYPSLAMDFGRAVLREELQAEDLFDEINRLTNMLLERMAPAKEEKAIIALYQKYLLLQKMLSLSLTHDEYAKVKREISGMTPSAISEMIISLGRHKAKKNKTTLAEIRSLDITFNQAQDFYEEALRRDQVIFDHTVQKMKTERKSTAVLITGGFHAPGLQQAMKNQGVAYVEVMPRINELSGEGQKTYENIMTLNADTTTKRSYVAAPVVVTDAVLRQEMPEYAAVANKLIVLNSQGIKPQPAKADLVIAASEVRGTKSKIGNFFTRLLGVETLEDRRVMTTDLPGLLDQPPVEVGSVTAGVEQEADVLESTIEVLAQDQVSQAEAVRIVPAVSPVTNIPFALVGDGMDLANKGIPVSLGDSEVIIEGSTVKINRYNTSRDGYAGGGVEFTAPIDLSTGYIIIEAQQSGTNLATLELKDADGTALQVVLAQDIRDQGNRALYVIPFGHADERFDASQIINAFVVINTANAQGAGYFRITALNELPSVLPVVPNGTLVNAIPNFNASTYMPIGITAAADFNSEGKIVSTEIDTVNGLQKFGGVGLAARDSRAHTIPAGYVQMIVTVNPADGVSRLDYIKFEGVGIGGVSNAETFYAGPFEAGVPTLVTIRTNQKNIGLNAIVENLNFIGTLSLEVKSVAVEPEEQLLEFAASNVLSPASNLPYAASGWNVRTIGINGPVDQASGHMAYTLNTVYDQGVMVTTDIHLTPEVETADISGITGFTFNVMTTAPSGQVRIEVISQNPETGQSSTSIIATGLEPNKLKSITVPAATFKNVDFTHFLGVAYVNHLEETADIFAYVRPHTTAPVSVSNDEVFMSMIDEVIVVREQSLGRYYVGGNRLGVKDLINYSFHPENAALSLEILPTNSNINRFVLIHQQDGGTAGLVYQRTLAADQGLPGRELGSAGLTAEEETEFGPQKIYGNSGVVYELSTGTLLTDYKTPESNSDFVYRSYRAGDEAQQPGSNVQVYEVINMLTGEEKQVGAFDHPNSFDISPDGKYAAVGFYVPSDAQTPFEHRTGVQLINLETGESTHISVPEGQRVEGVKFVSSDRIQIRVFNRPLITHTITEETGNRYLSVAEVIAIENIKVGEYLQAQYGSVSFDTVIRAIQDTEAVMRGTQTASNGFADANKDGSTNSNDILALMNYAYTRYSAQTQAFVEQVTNVSFSIYIEAGELLQYYVGPQGLRLRADQPKGEVYFPDTFDTWFLQSIISQTPVVNAIEVDFAGATARNLNQTYKAGDTVVLNIKHSGFPSATVINPDLYFVTYETYGLGGRGVRQTRHSIPKEDYKLQNGVFTWKIPDTFKNGGTFTLQILFSNIYTPYFVNITVQSTPQAIVVPDVSSPTPYKAGDATVLTHTSPNGKYTVVYSGDQLIASDENGIIGSLIAAAQQARTNTFAVTNDGVYFEGSQRGNLTLGFISWKDFREKNYQYRDLTGKVSEMAGAAIYPGNVRLNVDSSNPAIAEIRPVVGKTYRINLDTLEIIPTAPDIVGYLTQHYSAAGFAEVRKAMLDLVEHLNTPGAEYKNKFDVNEDGFVTSIDLLFLINYYNTFFQDEAQIFVQADANRDQALSSEEVTQIAFKVPNTDYPVLINMLTQLGVEPTPVNHAVFLNKYYGGVEYHHIHTAITSIINALNTNEPYDPRHDVEGDNHVSTMDALRLINVLNIVFPDRIVSADSDYSGRSSLPHLAHSRYQGEVTRILHLGVPVTLEGGTTPLEFPRNTTAYNPGSQVSTNYKEVGNPKVINDPVTGEVFAAGITQAVTKGTQTVVDYYVDLYKLNPSENKAVKVSPALNLNEGILLPREAVIQSWSLSVANNVPQFHVTFKVGSSLPQTSSLVLSGGKLVRQSALSDAEGEEFYSALPVSEDLLDLLATEQSKARAEVRTWDALEDELVKSKIEAVLAEDESRFRQLAFVEQEVLLTAYKIGKSRFTIEQLAAHANMTPDQLMKKVPLFVEKLLYPEKRADRLRIEQEKRTAARQAKLQSLGPVTLETSIQEFIKRSRNPKGVKSTFLKAQGVQTVGDLTKVFTVDELQHGLRTGAQTGISQATLGNIIEALKKFRLYGALISKAKKITMESSRSEVRIAASVDLQAYFNGYGVTVRSVAEVMKAAANIASIEYPKNIVEALLDSVAPETAENYQNPVRAQAMEAAREAMGQYAWMIESKEPVHLATPVNAKDLNAQDLAALSILFSQGDLLRLVVPGISDAQAKVIAQAAEKEALKLGNSNFTETVSLNASGSSENEIAGVLKRVAAGKLFTSANSAMLDSRMKVLNTVGATRSARLLSPSNLDEAIVVVITAALLRQQMPETYTVQDLEKWLSENKIDIRDVAQRVSQMIQAVKRIATAA